MNLELLVWGVLVGFTMLALFIGVVLIPRRMSGL